MMFPLIWNNQILYVPCFWYHVEEMIISLLFRNYYSWMYLERILKKITRAIHTPPQKNERRDKRKAQLLLVCALSVSPARNWFFACGIKIRFFYSMESSYIFRIGRRKFRNSCVQKTCLFLCVQISTWVSPVIC